MASFVGAARSYVEVRFQEGTICMEVEGCIQSWDGVGDMVLSYNKDHQERT